MHRWDYLCVLSKVKGAAPKHHLRQRSLVALFLRYRKARLGGTLCTTSPKALTRYI